MFAMEENPLVCRLRILKYSRNKLWWVIKIDVERVLSPSVRRLDSESALARQRFSRRQMILHRVLYWYDVLGEAS